MTLFLFSFVAGVLTVLAPCVLPLLPIIVGGSVSGSKRRPWLIALSLAVSVVLFTLLLKFSSAFVNIPPQTWQIISGILITVIGLTIVFPKAWDKINFGLGLSSGSENTLATSGRHSGAVGDILIGLSLGPVFSSCSPTYFLILATVLPQSFAMGFVDLIAYALGLALVLLLIGFFGQKFISRAKFAADPNGWFRRVLGVLFVIVGVFILFGLDRKLQIYLVEHNYFPAVNIEQNLLKKVDLKTTENTNTPVVEMPKVTKNYPRYREIVNPSGFVNSVPFTLSSLIGKKVIVVDFMTYSCINCIRTFPYLNAWYDKYKNAGLEIVGIHTPEFAFEKKRENVQKALDGFGIKFPVVLDNDYGTWRAYSNNYWPRKYLIDIDGYIIFDHIGEGEYEEFEQKIQQALAEKMARDGENKNKVASGVVAPAGVITKIDANSPETYFGSGRNEYLANGAVGKSGEQSLTLPDRVVLNRLYLSGRWNFYNEYIQGLNAGQIRYRYNAKAVYFVASAPDKGVKIKVELDGKPLSQDIAGSDIYFENGQSYLKVGEERLYSIIFDSSADEHVLDLIMETPGLNAYAFTFG